MGSAKDLNQPHVYAEALARAALNPNEEQLAAWLAGVGDLEQEPFAKWYRYFAQRLLDLAPRPEQGFNARPKHATPVPKIGRNDPCPCGSGKKFKNCHIAQEEVVSWKISSPTPAIRALAISGIIHRMSPEQLGQVPLEKAGDVALTEMASVYHAHEMREKALHVLKYAIDGDRDDPHMVYDYWIARYAEWLVEVERPKEAEEFLLDEYDAHRKVTKWQVAQKLAAFYIDQGDPDNGDTWVATALEGEPENPFNHYLKGLLLHSVENWDGAVAAYEQSRTLSDRFKEQEREMMVQLVDEALERARNHQPIEDDEEQQPADDSADA